MSQEDNVPQEITEALINMNIGEVIAVGPNVEIMGVPRGWIFYRIHKASITGTFVPHLTSPGGQRKAPVIDLSQTGMH